VPVAQVLARAVTQRFSLREILTKGDVLVAEVLPALRKDPAVLLLGIEVLGFSILSLKPTPEMAKALEAEAREALQRKSDDAIYLRRNNAVEQERIIKENELATEIAVEAKRRQGERHRREAVVQIRQRVGVPSGDAFQQRLVRHFRVAAQNPFLLDRKGYASPLRSDLLIKSFPPSPPNSWNKPLIISVNSTLS